MCRSFPLLSCLGLALACAGCTRFTGEQKSETPVEEPVSSSGTTDPAYDWEKSTGLRDNTSFIDAPFESTKTLDQTTKWLRWALLRYGHTHPTIYSDDITDVHFRECTMEWTEQQRPDDTSGVTSIARRVLDLRDVDLERGRVRFDTADVSFGTRESNKIAVYNRYFEKGQEKPNNGTPDHEGSARLPVKDADHIAARIAFAIFHAARVCGAPLPVNR